MYWLFAALANDRPSVTIVANGGSITLSEVAANVEAGRRMILIEGSGRAADALVSLLKGTTPSDGEVRDLRERAQKGKLTRRKELFNTVQLQAGATVSAMPSSWRLGPRSRHGTLRAETVGRRYGWAAPVTWATGS